MTRGVLKRILFLFLVCMASSGGGAMLLEIVAGPQMQTMFGWELVGVGFLAMSGCVLLVDLPDTVAWERQKRREGAAEDHLVRVLRLLPKGSSLSLVACASTPTDELFDVYRHVPGQRLMYLNPLLEDLLPMKEINGVRHVAVPCSTDLCLASRMLVLALERCLWGIHASPSFNYSYGFELDSDEAAFQGEFPS